MWEETIIEILVLGSAAVIPERGRDTASFLIDGELMIDCGWMSAMNIKAYGADPLAVRHLLVTHFHHDHYLGLPQLLFYKGHGARGKATSLEVIGPEESVAEIVDRANAFLQTDEFPQVIPPLAIRPTKPGERFAVGKWTVETCRSIHPVPGLCYRIEEEGGAAVVMAGDTAYNPDLARLAKGADLLFHEASHGTKAPEQNESGHSGGADAARVAKEAGVKRLALVHLGERRRAEAVDAAREIFPNTRFAVEGERIDLD